jgi:hypothetical protein
MSTTLLLPARTISNATVADGIALLQTQRAQKVDLVVPASSVRLHQGNLVIAGREAVMNEDGVTDINGEYRCTFQADGQLASLVDVPVRYIRKLRNEVRPIGLDLLDHNVNEWSQVADADRRILLRLMYGIDPENPEANGIVRAFLSSRYGIRDNYDVALTVLSAMKGQGLGKTNFRRFDLTDDRMYMRIETPDVCAAQPEWMDGYRPVSPYRDSGHGGASAQSPEAVHCGFVVKNTETGDGAFSINAEIIWKICDNGATIPTKVAGLSMRHSGARMDEGQVIWSDRTRQAANELAESQVTDAIQTFLNGDFLAARMAEINKVAGTPIMTGHVEVIEAVAKQLSYSELETQSIMDHFNLGCINNAGGVMQAITLASQFLTDRTRANELDATAIQAMEIAARIAA